MDIDVFRKHDVHTVIHPFQEHWSVILWHKKLRGD